MSIENLDQAALDYHQKPTPGKLGMEVIKPTKTPYDLSLAYTPGVAAPVRAIAKSKEDSYKYTIKGNLVAVVSNGTAVLGLGNVGPDASKPVMEGKAVLFKCFANVDVFDIELDAKTPTEVIAAVTAIAPTFGGINLEDIKAPECFEIEEALIKKLDIPVFHDDQHGTAIITSAGLLNALEIQGKKLSEAKVVCIGAGAAGIATMKLLLALGLKKENLFMVDKEGIIHTESKQSNPYKMFFARQTDKRTLTEALDGSDVLIGVSGPNIVTTDMIKKMNKNPIIFALSNPDPEITPALVQSVRDDVIMATGRSDYPNQVNNVLCFPFIFRGALDVRASNINQEMQIAAVHAIKDLAKEPVPQSVIDIYGRNDLSFGPKYIIPTPIDPRLMKRVPPAVARAAIKTGVARLGYPEHYPTS
jgi:malate dehydrogenase (oxaloacetate-decarboxylating)(NADP+)